MLLSKFNHHQSLPRLASYILLGFFLLLILDYSLASTYHDELIQEIKNKTINWGGSSKMPHQPESFNVIETTHTSFRGAAY